MELEWRVAICHPLSDQRLEARAELVLREHSCIGHRVTIITRDMRCENEDGKFIAGSLQYRGACMAAGCGWLGRLIRTDENGAVEDAHEHAHPGWRDIPIIEPLSSMASKKQEAAWVSECELIYGREWLDAGGPIKTWRNPVRMKDGTWLFGNRHVPGRAPGGGYDLGICRDVLDLDDSDLVEAQEQIMRLTNEPVTIKVPAVSVQLDLFS